MEINIVNQTNDDSWNEYEELYNQIADRTATFLQRDADAELSVIFVNDSQIHEVNRDYRSIDRPTDVISFALKDQDNEYEMVEGTNEIGDIFINIDAIRRQAKEYGHSEKRESCFLFTHGLLHLLGYDHMNEDEEKVMFALQNEILNEIVPKEVQR